jgi:hypothetical protein
MSEEQPTTDEIRELPAALLAGAADGKAAAWAKVIGDVEVQPIWMKPVCNWSVRPKGSAKQIAAIGKAVAIVAAEPPYARVAG